MLDAVCTHVTSSAASRDNAVKLMTDSYQFWVAHLNLRVTFQSHIRFARKVQKYGDAFSKSSSINIRDVGFFFAGHTFFTWTHIIYLDTQAWLYLLGHIA